MDECIKPLNHPYTILMTTFEAGENAKFSFSLWYKKEQGCEVSIVEA